MPTTKQRTAKSEASLTFQRPRTRAFVKKHQLSFHELFPSDGRAGSARVTPQGRHQSTEGANEQSTNKGTLKVLRGQRTTHFSQPFAHRVLSGDTISSEESATRAHEQGRSFKDKTVTETPVSAWLHCVGTGELEAPEIVDSLPTQSIGSSTSSAWEVASMNSTSSLNTSESTTDNVAGTQTSTVKKAKISYRELLEFRGITDEPSQDDKFNALRLEMITKEFQVDLDVESLHSILFILQKHQTQIKRAIKDRIFQGNMYLYEEVREDVEDWNPKDGSHRRFPAMSLRRFSFDRNHCLTSSEADFQRTLMISMIDRFDFQKVFTYSCEEQWTLEPDNLLSPLGAPNKIPQPKPDLAVSFQRSALRSMILPYPIYLSKCLHPGKKGDKRWFPFFFMEAKRADHTLEEAQERNLHNASQALFNIYQWMKMDEDLRTSFFNDVRVFTIALNVESFRLRVHRAEMSQAKGNGPDPRLFYHFQEVITISAYDRVKACNVIKTVLLDYAEACLLPLLRDAFQRTAQRELDHGNVKKRKQNELGRINPDLTDTDMEHGAESTPTASFTSQQPAASELSFDAGAIQLEAQPQPPIQVQPRKRGRVGGRVRT